MNLKSLRAVRSAAAILFAIGAISSPLRAIAQDSESPQEQPSASAEPDGGVESPPKEGATGEQTPAEGTNTEPEEKATSDKVKKEEVSKADESPKPESSADPPKEGIAQESDQQTMDSSDLFFNSFAEFSLVDLFELDIKTTTATKSVAISADEAPSIIHVISRTQIERYGYRTIGEALATVPGIFVIDDYVTSNVAIRGINGGTDSWSRVVKVMIDGKPAHYYSTGGSLLGPEFIPMDVVDRIEIIAGPGSALYGANAYLGVINVVTRTPKRGMHGQIAGEGGLIRGNFGGGGSAVASGEFFEKYPLGFLLSTSIERMDRSGLGVPESSPSADDYDGMAGKNDTSMPISALGKVNWRPGRAGEIEIFSAYQRLDAHAQFSAESVLSEENRYLKSNWINRLDYQVPIFDLGRNKKGSPASIYGLAKEKRINLNKLSFHTWGGITMGQSLPDEKFDVGSPLVYLHRDRANRTWEVGGEFMYQLERNSVLVGLDYSDTVDEGDQIIEIDLETNEENPRNEAEGLEYSNLGVFAQLMLYPLDFVGLTGGIRYDKSSQWKDNVSQRYAAVFNILKGLHLKLLYGTSFVPPAPTQVGAIPLQLTGGVQGNPDLKSQYAKTPEVALVFSYWKPLRTEISFFYTEIENRVEFIQQGTMLSAENMTNTKSLGGSLSADFNWRFLFAGGDLSVQKTTIKDPDVVNFQWGQVYGDDIVGKRNPPNFPHIVSRLNAGVSFPRYYIQASISGMYVGERKSSFANIIANGESYLLDQYFTLGAHIRTLGIEIIPFRETVISLHGTNLTNNSFSHGGSLGVDIPSRGICLFLRLNQEL